LGSYGIQERAVVSTAGSVTFGAEHVSGSGNKAVLVVVVVVMGEGSHILGDGGGESHCCLEGLTQVPSSSSSYYYYYYYYYYYHHYHHRRVPALTSCPSKTSAVWGYRRGSRSIRAGISTLVLRALPPKKHFTPLYLGQWRSSSLCSRGVVDGDGGGSRPAVAAIATLLLLRLHQPSTTSMATVSHHLNPFCCVICVIYIYIYGYIHCKASVYVLCQKGGRGGREEMIPPPSLMLV